MVPLRLPGASHCSTSMSASDRASGLVRGYRDLLVWQDAMDLVVTVYRTTATFPKEERYALVDQLRRAAVSVPSNIAEGHGRSRTGEYLRFLSVAVGSLMEIETQVQIATRLGYIPEEQQTRLLESTAVLARMLAGLIRALRRRLAQRNPDSRLPAPDS
jgi:four helix bundle protein